MPNVCYNDLTVIGPKKDIIELREKNIDFEYFYPTPKEVPDNDINKWRTEHWGTKWTLGELYIKDSFCYKYINGEPTEIIDNNVLDAKFETAWAPPVEFFKYYLRGHPKCRIKLQFSVIEMDISGIVILEMKDGELVERSLDWECFDTMYYQCKNESDSDSDSDSDKDFN